MSADAFAQVAENLSKPKLSRYEPRVTAEEQEHSELHHDVHHEKCVGLGQAENVPTRLELDTSERSRP